ncbi:MAG: ATP-binding protein [Thaumarchaeota archaeon]|nr:ATP-binding protein [Nitrososphaerota archaeon]
MSNLNDISESNRSKTARKNNAHGNVIPDIPKDADKGFPLLRIEENYYNFDDLIVKSDTKEILESVISEHMSAKKLFAYGFKPKSKILFCGPPGTGKTLSAKIISSVMGYPLAHVMFDSILSSYLGETATNLRRIFDFIEKEKFVVLFDEFDMVGKKRDDPHENGEIKRVVNNFMQMLDSFDGNSILIAATNHQQLLDKAVWRRFDDIIYFDLPDNKRRKMLFEKYLKVLRRDDDFTLDHLSRMTRNYSAADISQICENALRKCIIHDEKRVTKDHIMWSISEQKRRKKAVLVES